MKIFIDLNGYKIYYHEFIISYFTTFNTLILIIQY